MAQQVDPVKTARLFEFYVRRIWPLQRRFAAGRLSRRCTQCGASEKMLPLDRSGVCSACVAQRAAGLLPACRRAARPMRRCRRNWPRCWPRPRAAAAAATTRW